MGLGMRAGVEGNTHEVSHTICGHTLLEVILYCTRYNACVEAQGHVHQPNNSPWPTPTQPFHSHCLPPAGFVCLPTGRRRTAPWTSAQQLNPAPPHPCCLQVLCVSGQGGAGQRAFHQPDHLPCTAPHPNYFFLIACRLQVLCVCSSRGAGQCPVHQPNK